MNRPQMGEPRIIIRPSREKSLHSSLLSTNEGLREYAPRWMSELKVGGYILPLISSLSPVIRGAIKARVLELRMKRICLQLIIPI
jgi:hypothetical protein